ncbi:pentatricopeptide repeat-containing protein [Panicum miliaceum]|uniref:Pentatricopeptide repeat-containing protein n=1 Tax=Panicum miliaceum TaxID=4540 RepID=A0A3L6RR82_PANMI|nr:pentatricopeptide repeat-containing protein [Panicum miliaceum]
MEDHGLEPRAEHYAAYIDALGRNHKLEEATEFIKDLPSRIGPGTAGSWGALLGACRIHEVAEFLFRLEPGNSGRYVMLSNIYAAPGQWDNARRVRGLMKEKGLRKDQAYSWIEVWSAKHVFVAEDMSHQEADDIYEMLGKLLDHMRIAGDPTEHQLDFC